MATDRTKLEYEIATAANGEYLVRIRAPGTAPARPLGDVQGQGRCLPDDRNHPGERC